MKNTYAIPRINQVLMQYKSVVQTLTGTNLKNKAMQDIKTFIRSKPEIVSQLPAIAAAISSLRQDLMVEFFEDFSIALSDRYIVGRRPGMLPDDKELYFGIVLKPKTDDFTENKPLELWIELNPWDALFIGLEAKWRKTIIIDKDLTDLLVEVKRIIGLDSQHADYHYVTLEQTWNGTYWPVGGHDLANNFIRNATDLSCLIDREKRRRLISLLCDDVETYVAMLRSSFERAAQKSPTAVEEGFLNDPLASEFERVRPPD